MRLKFLTALAMIALAGSAEAASFDCAKARSADEKAIGADRGLNDRDVKMTTMLGIAEGLVAMGSRGDMQDAQVVWLKARHACGADRLCLSKSYDDRIAVIQGYLAAIESRGPF
jgi:uncharacterized protein